MIREPESLDKLASRLIGMAVQLCQDPEKVRERLGCSPADFEAYRTARKAPSSAILNTLVSIVMEEQNKIIERNRSFLAEARAKQDKLFPRKK